MSLVNSLLRAVFDLALRPFEGLPALAGLASVSLPVAVFMLLIFKKTSRQEALAAVKRQIHACLFEIRLYNDDLRAILRAQVEMFGWNLRYISLSLVPLAWMIVPLVLVIAQLEFHYGYAGLAPEQTVLVKATLREGADAKPSASLEAPEGLRVETPALWIPEQRELAWRIRAEKPGAYELRLSVGDASATKSVIVSDTLTRRSPRRVSTGFLDQLLYPAEAPLPASSPLASIAVGYPDRDVDVLGFGVHWMVVFFVLSILFALALRRPLGVTI